MIINKNILFHIIESNKTMLIIIFMFILNFFVPILNLYDYYFFDGFIWTLTLGEYSLILTILLLISTYNVVSILSNYTELILRFKTKEEYFKTLIKYVIIINLIVIILNYLLLTSSCLLFSNGVVIKDDYINGTSNLYYMIWISVRQAIVLVLLSLVFLIVRISVKMPYNTIICLLFCIAIFIASYNDIIVTSLSKIFVFYYDYFRVHRYSSLLLEISCFTFYHCIYIFILYIVYKIILKKTSIII